jgi:competence protein ComEC
LGFFFRWRVRVVVSIVAIVLFMVMVGLSASVLRAGSMAILMLMAMAIGRQYNVMRALLCVAVLMVYVNPYILRYDIGFQFSVMATLGLVIAMPHFETVLAKRPFLVSIGSFFWSTIATQIAVLPLLLYHIGAASVVSLIANVLVLPAVPLGMLLSFTVGVMGFIDPMLAEVSAFFAYLVLTYITILAAWAASVPFAVITVTYFPGFLVWIYYGTITIAISFYVYRQRYKIKTTSRCGEVAVTPVYFTRSDSLPRSN